MTGISHLNIVVQQGGSAKDVHHIKQQAIEHTQMVSAQQEAIREADLRDKVTESEASEQLGLKREKSKEKNDRQRSKEGKKKKKEEEKEMVLTGKLLDTVA